MDLDPSTFDDMTAEEFVRIIRGMSDREILATMRGEHRVAILDGIFEHFPLVFSAERAQGVSQVTHMRITGGPPDHPDDTYEVVVNDGECWIADEPGPDYDVSLMMGPVELTKLITGTANPTLMVMRGKLKVRGDVTLAKRFSSYFTSPGA